MVTSEGGNERGFLLAQDQEHCCLSHQGGGGGCPRQLVELACSQGEGITSLSREEVLREMVLVVMRQGLFCCTYLSEPVMEEEPDNNL